MLESAVMSIYQAYLKTRTWSLRKSLKLREARYRCERCGCAERLHVHHKTYKNIFNEPLKDLLALCGNCHIAIHSGI